MKDTADMTKDELIAELVTWHIEDDLRHCEMDEVLICYGDMLKNGWRGFNNYSIEELMYEVDLKREVL